MKLNKLLYTISYDYNIIIANSADETILSIKPFESREKIFKYEKIDVLRFDIVNNNTFKIMLYV